MLSILIPEYNYNCFQLIEALSAQATLLEIEFEIIVVDDGSTTPFDENKRIATLPHCQYVELGENVGRSRIRNILADKAAYNYLLFIDCDSAVSSEYYIQRYLNFCKEENIVVCGGRTYKKEPPEDKNLYLHWYYGSKRETIDVKVRQRNPYRSFMSNNFLISRTLFNKIRFNENISSYGHEDSLFGYKIRKLNATVYHIDNPLVHIGLEPAAKILDKEKNSIKNLMLISEKYADKNELANDIKLLRCVMKLEKSHLCGLVAFMVGLSKKYIYKNIQSDSPSLFLLDLYKLGYYCHQQTAHKS